MSKQKNIFSFFFHSDDPNQHLFKGLLRLAVILVIFFFFVFGVVFVVQLKFSQKFQRRLPDYVNEDIVTVLEDLQKNRLKVWVHRLYDQNVPRYHIIDQKPKPGTIVKTGRRVLLKVSLGSKVSKMPDFINEPVSKAKNELLLLYSAYEVLPNILERRVYSKTVSEGHVIKHFPLPGEKIKETGDILFLVSRGLAGDDFPLPNYKWRSFREVESELQGIDINVRYIPKETSEKKHVGKIYNQSPEPGTYITKGDTVTLNVLIPKPKRKSETLKKEVRTYRMKVPFKEEHNDTINEILSEDDLWKYIDTEKARQKFIKQYEQEDLSKEELNEKLKQIDEAAKKQKLFEEVSRIVIITVVDELGSSVRLKDRFLPGQYIDLPFETLGDGQLRVYLDDQLYDITTFYADTE